MSRSNGNVCSTNFYVDASTAQKMKFSIKGFFSKCDQIHSFMRIWSHLLNKSLTENFDFCVVFGLSSAPRDFTKLMKVARSFLRKRFVRITIYLEDMLLMADSLEVLLIARDKVIFLLQNFGAFNQHSKVNTRSDIKFGVSRNISRFTENDTKSATRESGKDKKPMQRASIKVISNGQRIK